MHEHGLVESLLRRVTEIAVTEKAERVVRISVWLGALSHMSPAHFGEHFERAAAGSIAEGAELDCAASDDVNDQNAARILLTEVEVE